MPPRRTPPSRRSDSFEGWYPPSRPLRVDGGIRARSQRGQIGESWWSRRFIDLLESLGLGGRLDRGKRYARQGQVLSLELGAGSVTAKVQGSRARPYGVRIGIPTLDEAQWRQVEAELAEQAVFLAKLLAGDMPRDIEDAFSALGLSLFPASIGDLDAECSCPDWSNPCKHIAAVYYLLGEAFDDDPFLILFWRGREREVLLDNLRALRGSAAWSTAPTTLDDPWHLIEQVPPPDVDAGPGFWGAHAIVGLTSEHPPALDNDAQLRQRDALDRTVGGRPLVETLRPAYAAFATTRDRLLADRIPDQ